MTTYPIIRHPDTHPTSHVVHKHTDVSHLFLAENAAGERVLWFGTGPDDRHAEEVDLGLNTASASAAILAVLVAHVEASDPKRKNKCEECGSVGESELDTEGLCSFCSFSIRVCVICGTPEGGAYSKACCADPDNIEEV